MKQKQRIKLLTKTTSIYLVFTFAAFFFSALFLINETDEYINSELDRRYQWTEGKIISNIKNKINSIIIVSSSFLEIKLLFKFFSILIKVLKLINNENIPNNNPNK